VRDVLIVLNARRIPEVLEAIEELDIDRLWVRNLWMHEIEARWDEVEEAFSEYAWAWIMCDDVVVSQDALNAVRELAGEGFPVVTGYCNLDAVDPRVMLTRSRLGPRSEVGAYDFYSLREVKEGPRVLPTTFVNYCLTGMSVEMWREYPLRNESEGNAADFNLSRRLVEDGIVAVAHRDAFCWHLKDEWNTPNRDPRKRLLMGSEPSAIELEVRV
jgi:hypothetical protein